MRVIVDNYSPNTEYEFFGNKLTMPIMGAAITDDNSFRGDKVITEPEFYKQLFLEQKWLEQ
ncbi:MAG: hypothetical protein ACTSSG_04980 [Candidatus Heimdallarchaeaceae archaeon]